MRALMRVWLGVALLVPGACAMAPVPPPHVASEATDSLGTIWGDEYEDGLVPDAPGRPARGLAAEWIHGDASSARLDATAEGASVRLRRSPRGELASLGWRGAGFLRDVTVGHVEASLAEGALAGDARAGSDLRASASVHSEGLRMEPGSSPWASARGAGVVCAAGALRIGLGGCESPVDVSQRTGFASLERHADGAVMGAAAGMRAGDPSRTAFSLYGARRDDASFASGEIMTAPGQVRTVARLVAGERRQWSALAIAGAGPASGEPLVFSRRERWGAALERRDAWGWGASRAGASSLTRRDDVSDVQRRRLFWDGMWRVSPGARLELAARITREHAERRPGGVLAALPVPETADDWRARATVRTYAGDPGRAVENAYRLEWVQGRSGRPGTVASWTCRVVRDPFDARVSARAHALHAGQVAYEPDPAPMAWGGYTAIAGKGAAVTTSLRVRLAERAWIAATWSRRPPAEPRAWIAVGVRL